MDERIEFFNRHAGAVERETVYGDRWLRWIYGNPVGKAALHLLVKRKLFSRWYGWRMDQPASAVRVPAFMVRFGIDEKEFLKPALEFGSFNEFFARELKPECRPIDPDPAVVVFPADGRHLGFQEIAEADRFFAKGIAFDLATFLGDVELAARFAGGSLVLSRLCPVDYHRFHFPVSGRPEVSRRIEGSLYSVNPVALWKRPSILWENRREVTRLRETPVGDVIIIEVGATCVGSIIQTYDAATAVARGDEKGFFRFGGSLVATLFEPGRVRLADDLVEQAEQGRELYAKMGSVLGYAGTSSSHARS